MRGEEPRERDQHPGLLLRSWTGLHHDGSVSMQHGEVHEVTTIHRSVTYFRKCCEGHVSVRGRQRHLPWATESPGCTIRTIRWLFHDQPVELHARFSTHASDSDRKLVISNCRRGDSGPVTAVIGDARITAQLRVRGQLSWANKLKSTERHAHFEFELVSS